MHENESEILNQNIFSSEKNLNILWHSIRAVSEHQNETAKITIFQGAEIILVPDPRSRVP